MMFNWNERDQAEGTLWSDLSETNHTGCHLMEIEVDSLFPGGEYDNNKRDGLTSDTRCTEQSSQAKNDHINYISDGTSSFQTNEELSSSQIEIDSWLDFPSLCLELKDGYNDGNNDNPVMALMSDLTDASNTNSVRGGSMQLNLESDLFSHEDKENDDFLECDWETFGFFDDIEKPFRKNESIFGHDMVGDAEGLLSPSKDAIDITAQSIPLPDLPLCKNQTPDEGCSSFQSDDHIGKQRCPLHEEKVDERKITPTSPNKAEERRKNIPRRNLKGSYNQNQHNASTSIQSSITIPVQAFQPKATNQEMQFCDAKRMRNQGSSSQVAFTHHGYPTDCFPGVWLSSHDQIDRNQNRPVPSTYEVGPGDIKHPKTSNRLPDGKQGTMTAQDKMEKLRRLQQMQAQLAIEKQQKQYSHQLSDAGISATQSSTLTYESPSEEVMFYQLRDVIEKLDIRTRLCIRDSLFRLSRSAMERQSASDRSSTNKSSKDEDEVSSDEELRNHDRSTIRGDPETGTNPIDRFVANLLFQRPTEACPRLGSYELLTAT